MNIDEIKRKAPSGAEYAACNSSGYVAYFKDRKMGYSGPLEVFHDGEWKTALSKIEDLNPENYEMVIAL